MELYVATRITNWMMDMTEKTFGKGAVDSNLHFKVTVAKMKIEFKAPYPGVPLEAIKIHTF